MENKFISTYQEQKDYVETGLKEMAKKLSCKAIAELGIESMKYILLAGGKTIITIFCLQ